MSAQDQMRQMLDELMGTTRDGASRAPARCLPLLAETRQYCGHAPAIRVLQNIWCANAKGRRKQHYRRAGGDARKYTVRFDDPTVCKGFLLGSCPHDTLAGTRMDLGDCKGVHDLALRADYEMAAKNKEYYYEIDALEQLESFIKDCDHRTEMAKLKLKETQEELSAEVAAKLEVVHDLAEQIGKTLAHAEAVGAEGNVDESLKLMEEVEELNNKKGTAEREYSMSMPSSSYQQQKLRVCEVCSAYLGIHDNDRRLADHFGGKLHLGFIKIREKLEELRVAAAGKIKDRDAEREKRRQERDRERAAGHNRDRDDERRRRSRSRSRDRDRRDRYRDDRDSGSRSSSHSKSSRSDGDRRRQRHRDYH